MLGSFQVSWVSLSRQLVVHIIALILCVGLAALPCSNGFLLSGHPAAAPKFGQPFSRHLDWAQHLQSSRLAAETHRTTHPRRDLTSASDSISAVSGDSNSTRAPPHSEVEALAAFKAAIKRDPTGALTSWIVGSAAGNDSDPCTGWVGVTCSTQSPIHVVSLDLSNLQLVGSLDTSLRALARLSPFLQSLDLSANVFSGFIPGESLTNFSRLSYFNLSSNIVTGEIPPETGSLLSLEDLDVSLNNLSGVIPVSLGNCSSLRILDLSWNALEGGIPASLGALSALEQLTVGHNSLSGTVPGALGNCSSLQVLDLRFNLPLVGALPQELGLLKHLQIIFLEYNGFSGTFPAWIGNLTSLTLFSSFGNSFDGEIPETIGQLTALEFFNVANSQITGSIPASIFNVTSLLLLQLQSGYLSGHIPPEIGMLPNLYWLNLAANQFTGLIPSSLANCSSLSVLELGLNELMDPQPIPQWIESLTPLTNIYFSFMNLQGDLSESTNLGKLFNLVYFDVDGNNLTGNIPASLQNCSYLNEIDVGGNKLTGVIPPALGVLTSMITFVAGANFLSGSFPEFITNWTQLSIFSVQNCQLGGLLDGRVRVDQLGQLGLFEIAGNDFEGPIPEAFGNSSSIYLLDLSDNLLSGPIPALLGNMTSLQGLNLESNSLEGAIPVSLLTSGQSLSTLDLGQNQLDGSLPSEIGQLAQLEDLILSNNKFIGVIPDTLGNCSKMANLDLSRNEFQGNIPAAAIAAMSTSLISLNLSRNLLSGTFPKEFTKLTSVQAINISFNNISGPLPVGLGKCISLRSLDVSMNNLTGELPQDLGSLTHLEFFNASFNYFTGPIPQSGLFNSSRINESSFLGNPGLCGASSIIGLQHGVCAAIPLNVSSNHRGCKGFHCKQSWIPVVVVSTVVLLGAVLGVIVVIRYGWIWNRGGDDNSKAQFLLNFGAQMRLTERDVLRTIEDPTGDNVIGAGARSIVYKGVLQGGEMFALKKLQPDHEFRGPHNKDSGSKGAADGELVKEAKILAKLRHKNILKCLSFFSNQDNRALIMEYMSGGSLHKHLHEVEPCSLTWQTRFKIAMGVAEGMKYLHHDFPEPLIHRDLKPSNIFLDEDFEVKVGDFGISKFVTPERDGEATASTVCGTIGYMPPEYANQTWVSTKGDVYSYGMVLIELLTGRQPCSMDDSEGEGGDLRNWVLDHFQGRQLEVLDPCLVNECNQDDNAKEQMTLLLRVSLLCTRAQNQSRPSMADVVGMLIYIGNVGVKPVIMRTVEELTNDVDPSVWVAQDPVSEGPEFNSNC